MPKRIIISTVGTSLLLNQATTTERSIINAFSNAKLENYTDEAIGLLSALEHKAIEKLENANITQLRSISAELNGIYGLYNEKFEGCETDQHYLIITDTLQGETTGRIVKTQLNTIFHSVELITPKGLSTEDKAHFTNGIKDLLKWCDDVLDAYKKSGYEIVFNLTGGFKSLQGYLNTIGMFYADRIIYIFEKGNELIEIPKLPVKIDDALFVINASLFLQLANDKLFDKQVLQGIPDTMLEEIEDNQFVLSAWGTLAWNNAKGQILAENLVTLPHIVYEGSFKKDFSNTIQGNEKVKLQETLVKVSCLLQDNKGDTAALKGGRGGGLLYDNFTGKHSNIGHFRISQSIRVSCTANNGNLYLRHYGAHDYVEHNP